MVQKDIKINKNFGFKVCLELVASEEKITIKNYKNILNQNNEKLGTTQISISKRVKKWRIKLMSNFIQVNIIAIQKML